MGEELGIMEGDQFKGSVDGINVGEVGRGICNEVVVDFFNINVEEDFLEVYFDNKM